MATHPDGSPLGVTHLIAMGGFDPSGAAGVVRDGLTARARGASFTLIPTAMTAQWPGQEIAIGDCDPQDVVRMLGCALAHHDGEPIGIKIGMVANPAMAQTIAKALQGVRAPVVFDPVLRASAGAALFRDGKTDSLGFGDALAPLIARADLLTPNVPECLALGGLGKQMLNAWPDALARLFDLGARAILVKGGHADAVGSVEDCVDSLFEKANAPVVPLRQPRVQGRDPRGTGCALASAIAIALAEGRTLEAACRDAQAFVHQQITDARPVGSQFHLPG